MKYLCLCERGNCRSVALAYLLKDRLGENALAAGTTANGSGPHGVETMTMLFNWADRILITDSRLIERVPAAHMPKIRLLNVGPDRWWRPPDAELLGLFIGMLMRAEHQ